MSLRIVWKDDRTGKSGDLRYLRAICDDLCMDVRGLLFDVLGTRQELKLFHGDMEEADVDLAGSNSLLG